jgi:hypothetical protein
MNLDDTPALFFPLLRPEYVVNPEYFQSAVAWEKIQGVHKRGDGQARGLIYLRPGNDPRTVSIDRTSPLDEGLSAADREVIAEKIASLGGLSPGSGAVVMEALARSLEGVKPERAKATCALAITPETALLQDARGVTGKKNPANLGKNINTMYWLGTAALDTTASDLWWDVMSQGDDQELISWIRAVTKACLLPSDVVPLLETILPRNELVSSETIGTPPRWLTDLESGTPFSWFQGVWTKLCTPEWFSALPRRRWADWASCVLRTAIGFGFLWEMHFYSTLLSGLLDKDRSPTDVVNAATSSSNGLLIWNERTNTSSRDVASYLKRLVKDGSCAMTLLASFISENKTLRPALYADRAEGLADWIAAGRKFLDKADKPKGGTAWGIALANGLVEGPSSGWVNTEETIKYALLCRDPFGKNADYYGLLQKRGSRFTVVAPSTEWLVVVASLAAPTPGSEVHLEDVIQSLAELGLRPDYNTLINEVERAGLGRGSHDADEAISIATAF